jgi:hypothetical protein
MAEPEQPTMNHTVKATIRGWRDIILPDPT